MMKRNRAPARTLARMRAEAPQRDREDAALRPAPLPAAEVRFARTIPQLRQRCGNYGDTAVVHARYSAVKSWLMSPDTAPTEHPFTATFEAVSMCAEEVWFNSGLPTPDRGPRLKPIIERISQDLKPLARSIAADTMRAWEAAGMPFLHADRITRSHQYTLACIKAQTEEQRA